MWILEMRIKGEMIRTYRTETWREIHKVLESLLVIDEVSDKDSNMEYAIYWQRPLEDWV